MSPVQFVRYVPGPYHFLYPPPPLLPPGGITKNSERVNCICCVHAIALANTDRMDGVFSPVL